MSVTVQTKDMGDTKVVYDRSVGYVKTFEGRNEDWIKSEFEI